MTTAVFNPSYLGSFFGIRRSRPGEVGDQPQLRSTFGDVIVIAFLLAQALDGVFTYVGIKTFGPGIEGNPLILTAMVNLGHGFAVAGAKVLAATFGVTLHLFGVHRIIAVLTGVYVAAAILPWTAVLFFAGR